MPAIAPHAPHTALAGPGASEGHGWAAQWPRLPGLLVALGIAAIAIAMGRWHWLADHGLSPLVLAIALGIAAGNTVYPRWAAACDAGVGHAKQTWLRAGIVLYGLRLTLQDIAHLGWAGLAVDALVLSSTFVLAVWLGTRWLGLERSTAVLIGAGSSICGAAAVLATAPVARARNDQVAVAVATVVVFGTLAVFIYPTLAAALQPAVGDPRFAGLYMGSTIHEVAQVVAAGRSLGEGTADMAIVAKLVRVLMLAPFLVALSWWLGRDRSGRDGQSRSCRPATRDCRSVVCRRLHGGGGAAFAVPAARCREPGGHDTGHRAAGHGHGGARPGHAPHRDPARRHQTPDPGQCAVRLAAGWRRRHQRRRTAPRLIAAGHDSKNKRGHFPRDWCRPAYEFSHSP